MIYVILESYGPSSYLRYSNVHQQIHKTRFENGQNTSVNHLFNYIITFKEDLYLEIFEDDIQVFF